MDSNRKGDLAILKVAMRALEKGAILHRPFNDLCRYDCILDWNDKLYRIEIKYIGHDPQCADGVIPVVLGKRLKGKLVPYLESEIDALVVYSPVTDKVYWIPPEKFHDNLGFHLRIFPCKNNQKKKIVWAKDFEW